ncbi:MAG: ExeA family protein [Planctomycetota bacterium]
MYESYWNLNHKPFPSRHEPGRFYRSKSHHSALLRLKYSIDNLSGPNVILGLSGTGKSSLVRQLPEQDSLLNPFVQVVFPTLTPGELLRLIAVELSSTANTESTGTDSVLKDIQTALHRHAAKGLLPVICFDDAQLLSEAAIHSVVLPLLNLVEADRSCKLSILLVGQPALASQLRRIGSLAERIAVTTAIQGFTASETADYVKSSLCAVGGAPDIFTPGALERLFEVTSGNPRRINRLCEMALLVGYAEQLQHLTETQIDSVAGELLPNAA